MTHKKHFFLWLLFLTASSFSLFADKSRQEIVRELFNAVEKWMGTPYVYGGDSEKGIDCSAFTARVYRSVFNIQLPRTVSAQKRLGSLVTDNLQPGDLIFFTIGGKISHVGVYVFDQKFIHAASAGPSVGVVKSSLTESYYKKRYAYARRLVKLPPFQGKKEVPDQKTMKKSEKSLSPKPSFPEEEITGSLDFRVGSVLYRGFVADEPTKFDKNKELVFYLKNIRFHENNYTIEIKNQNTGRVKVIHLFDIHPGEKAIQKLYLPQGDYLIQLKISTKKLFLEKRITVF